MTALDLNNEINGKTWPVKTGRPSKPPRLLLHNWPKGGRNAMWVIRDGQRTRGTGCHEADRAGAEVQLARYIEANPPAPPKPLPPPNSCEAGSASQFIYIVGSKRLDAVKIGISALPHVRLRSLQTSNFHRLEVLAQIAGTVEQERALHRLFKRDHRNGEWFTRTAEIEKFIELIGRRGLPIHLAVKWITDDRREGRDHAPIP